MYVFIDFIIPIFIALTYVNPHFQCPKFHMYNYFIIFFSCFFLLYFATSGDWINKKKIWDVLRGAKGYREGTLYIHIHRYILYIYFGCYSKLFKVNVKAQCCRNLRANV